MKGTVVFLECSLAERIKRIKNRDGIDVNKESLNHISETDCLKYKNYNYKINTENGTIQENYELIKKGIGI